MVSERTLVRIGVGAIALHIVDDSFLQPQRHDRAAGQGGEDLSQDFYESAGEPKAVWEVPEGGNVGGAEARPREYERRVVGFFDEALLR